MGKLTKIGAVKNNTDKRNPSVMRGLDAPSVISSHHQDGNHPGLNTNAW